MNSQPDYLPNPHVPLYPRNGFVRHFVQLMDGQSQSTFFSMKGIVDANVGTPQETADWSEPENWIPQLLDGKEQELALRLWRGSEQQLNPRHLLGTWLMCNRYGLLRVDSYDTLCITKEGQDFVDHWQGATVQHIDYMEGLLQLLLTVSEHGPGKRSDLVPPYLEFLERYSDYRSPRVQVSAWYYRIRNLVERSLVKRSGVAYEISQEGLSYLELVGHLLERTGREPVTQPQTDIRRLLKEQGDDVRERLREALSVMHPYAVELLVKRLLEAMNYEDVEVTSRSNDGGVDVVADIEVGITPVREVVQVKRHKANIQRRVLDELRGSLHRFDAMRGTIITTGKFSKGAQDAAFERNAAPITLIDGDRLIDLLIDNEIGVRKRTIQLVEFEPADFAEKDVE